LKKKIALLLLVFLVILTLSGCGSSIRDLFGLDGGSGTPSSSERLWTVMVYIAAANNMQDVANFNINQMEKVGSTPNLTILVQLDTKSNCYRYFITRDNDEQNITSPIIAKMPHQNSGDPAVLTDFIKWAKQNYPAKHYALILWNHGSGWKPASTRVLPRAICFDYVSNDALDTDELRTALANAGVKLGLLGMDACLMQMTEVATEVKDWAQVVCGSQEDEPWNGWPYDAFLGALAQNPSMDAVQLGKTIVSSYISYYNGSGLSATLSAVSTSPLEQFAQSIDALGAKLTSLYPSSTIDSIINSTQTFSDNDYKDIFHFAELVSQKVQSAQAEANAILNLKNQVVIDNGQIKVDNAQGLSIYLPTTAFSNYVQSYSQLVFGQLAPNWVLFLKKLNGL